MTTKGGQRKGPKSLSASPNAAVQKPYTVLLTASAEAVYLELRERALAAEARDGAATSQHCTTFRMVDEAIRNIIPADPLNRKYALHAPLEDMYRIAKGRLRIAWVAESKHRQLLILFISDTPRKEGDAQDPYRILTAMMKSGHLNSIVEDWRRALDIPPDSSVH
jgi:Toxin with endonuclease activity, of toxin-antitoxin system